MANDVKYIIGLCRQDCATLDPTDLGYFNEIPSADFSIAPIDVYGGLGFNSGSFLGRDHGKFCDLYCYCDGPTDDGVTPDWQWERYETRWIGVFEAGEMFYGKVGDILVPAPAALFPDTPFEDVIKISMSFDMNARPCFCMEYGNGLIEIRRFEAGIPQKISFTGKSPVLIQNGILQLDLDLRDVVCYYSDGSNIKARFQRDEFATEYDIVTGISGVRLKVNDRGRGTAASYHFLETETTTGSQTIYFINYPPWPIYNEDNCAASCTLGSDVDHSKVIVDFTEGEQLSVLCSLGNDVSYLFPIAQFSESDSAAASCSLGGDVSYEIVVITASPTSDSCASSITLNSDIDYIETVVAFSNADTAQASCTLNSDIDYSV